MLRLLKSKNKVYLGSNIFWTILAVICLSVFLLPYLSAFVYTASPFLSGIILLFILTTNFVVPYLLFEIGRKICELGRKDGVPVMNNRLIAFLLAGTVIITPLFSLFSTLLPASDDFSFSWVSLLGGFISTALLLFIICTIQLTLNDVLIAEKMGTSKEVESKKIPGFMIGGIVAAIFTIIILLPLWIFARTNEFPGYGSDMGFLLILSRIDFPAYIVLALLRINPLHPVGLLILIGTNVICGSLLGRLCEYVTYLLPSFRKHIAKA